MNILRNIPNTPEEVTEDVAMMGVMKDKIINSTTMTIKKAT
ncbi:hypothetical protein BNJ_00186 [Kaumoebavirus]|nr:hypothetical protein BNJ_00186 [Kaumoebavirus]ARA72017.1 hypothetical protein BNJ_00186 [Kaumoebavirus]